jgi:hypothetical protein
VRVCVRAMVGQILQLLLLLPLFRVMLVILTSDEESASAPVRVRGTCGNGSFVINLLMNTMADVAVCCVLPSSPMRPCMSLGVPRHGRGYADEGTRPMM